MNIGIVTTWFERGAAYVSKSYLKLLKEIGFNVFIYARGGEKYANNDPVWDIPAVTWGRIPSKRVPMAINKNDFVTWINSNKIDAIIFNEQQSWEPVIWCDQLNVIAGAYVDYYTEETIPLFQNYDFLLCNTHRHFETFSWHAQTFYIPWGTDIQLFHPVNFNLVNNNEVTFFHSCGMSPYRKGTDLVISAFSKIKNDAKLILHSQQPIIQLIPEIENLVNDLVSKQKLICYEGSVSAPGLYHLGDVYVYPSRLDGIGLTVAEALASGLPTIISDNKPMNEFFDPASSQKVKVERLFSREDGYYWPQCLVNENALIDAMNFYVKNKKLVPTLKKAARQYAVKDLNWNDRGNQLREIFNTIKKIDAVSKRKAKMAAIHYENKRSNELVELIKNPYTLFVIKWLWTLLLYYRNIKSKIHSVSLKFKFL